MSSYMSIKEFDGCGHGTEGKNASDPEEDHEDINKVAFVCHILVLLLAR